MDRALQTTQKTTTLKLKELGGSWTKKRASKSCTQKRERSPQHPKQNKELVQELNEK